MIPMEKALGILTRRIRRRTKTQEVPLLSCLDRVLAESVKSDLDLPPFHRSAMDGFAVRAQDVKRAPCRLQVVETVHAGEVPKKKLHAGQACRIMTGAPLPKGADAVVMVERTELASDGASVVILEKVEPQENYCPRGEDLKKGRRILSAGAVLDPVSIGMLATVGRPVVSCYRRPKVTILSTGDELVAPGEPLGPGKIRNSNAFTLAELVRSYSGDPVVPGIVRDNRRSLAAAVRAGLRSDVLLLSGGVSMGALDLVPEILSNAGVKTHFHRVAIKPAKPILFGTTDTCLVFGLPGNPVSSLIGFLVFVAPTLANLQGKKVEPGHWPTARLGVETRTSPRLTEFRPHTLARDNRGAYRLDPVEYNGSGHLASLLSAEAMAVLPEGVSKVPRGALVSYVSLPQPRLA